MNDILKEYENATVIAITPAKECVGIKIFTEPIQSMSTGNAREHFEDYLKRSLTAAIELKMKIESGKFNIRGNTNPNIIMNYNNNDLISRDQLVHDQYKRSQQLAMLKMENEFIDLGRALIESIQIGRLDLKVCEICLVEMYFLTRKKSFAPIILKKNPQIVQWVAKLCRFAESNRNGATPQSEKSQYIRKRAKDLMTLFKMVMNFTDADEKFIPWFCETVHLFHELIAHLSDEQKQQLTDDPDIQLKK